MTDRISGVVRSVSSTTTQKEGKDGMVKEEEKKKISIDGVGDYEGVKIQIISSDEAVDLQYRLMEDVTITIQTPQQRLPVQETRAREPVEEDDDEDA